MADIVDNLSLLFDRPNEPMIIPKGDDKALFELTEEFLVSLLQNLIYKKKHYIKKTFIFLIPNIFCVWKFSLLIYNTIFLTPTYFQNIIAPGIREQWRRIEQPFR